MPQKFSGAKVLQIIIPMAGSGLRFRERGYALPKPLLPVFGRAMIARVADILKIAEVSRLSVVYNSTAVEPSALLAELGPNTRLVPIVGTTEGAAITVLRALDDFDPMDEILIANSDQLVRFDFPNFLAEARTRNSDGSMLTFPANDPRWSYAQTDEQGWVQRVAEKDVISSLATVGIYYIKSCKAFREAAFRMIEAEDRVLGEFYVAPVYNWMIKSGARVSVYHLDGNRGEMHGLGTPDDYEKFLREDPLQMGSRT